MPYPIISGKKRFIELNDTPNSYSGMGGLYVRVKSTEDGLEFASGGGGGGGKPFPTRLVAASNAKTTTGADYICDGTDDQTEINQAISDLSSTGGIVWLSEGTFNISGTINLDSNIMLIGSGNTTISSSASNNIIYISNKDNVVVKNLHIDGNNTGSAYGIHIEDSNNVKIVDCVIENIDTDAVYIESPSATIENILVANNKIMNWKSSYKGIYLYGVVKSFIVNNYIKAPDVATGTTPIRISPGGDSGGREILVSGNYIEKGLKGIELYGGADNRIVGNFITGGSYGIGFNPDITGTVIDGNIFYNIGYTGIALSRNNNYNTIVGNVFREISYYGILFYGSSGQEAIGNVISGNTFINCGKAGAYYVIELWHTKYNIVSNNVMYTTTTNKPYYGIYEIDSDYNVFANNIIEGVSMDKYYIVGAHSKLIG